MPANPRSLAITDAYRARTVTLARGVEAAARTWWLDVTVDDLDETHRTWVDRTTAALEVAQRAGVRLSTAYLAAYVASELGGRPVPAVVHEDRYVAGEDGGPLRDAVDVTAIVAVRVALKDGKPATDALAEGIGRGARQVATVAAAASRFALADAMRAEPRVVGWRRVSGGGCGACMAAATGAIRADDEVLEVHPFCQCSAEPVVADADETVARATGEELFADLTPAEQDRRLGAAAADAVRSGDAQLADLVAVSPQAAVGDRITQRPLGA